MNFVSHHRSKDSHRIDASKKYEISQDEISVSLTIRDVSEKDSGSYTLEASNDLGSVSTSGQLDVQGRIDGPALDSYFQKFFTKYSFEKVTIFFEDR